MDGRKDDVIFLIMVMTMSNQQLWGRYSWLHPYFQDCLEERRGVDGEEWVLRCRCLCLSGCVVVRIRLDGRHIAVRIGLIGQDSVDKSKGKVR